MQYWCRSRELKDASDKVTLGSPERRQERLRQHPTFSRSSPLLQRASLGTDDSCSSPAKNTGDDVSTFAKSQV